MRVIDAPEVETVSYTQAVAALERALHGVDGVAVDPEQDGQRTRLTTATGELLLMPSASPVGTGVKILTVTTRNVTRGLPVIQGVYTLFDAGTGVPLAVLDGAALTSLRTPAVSALAVKHLGPPPAGARLVVLGAGVQGRRHVAAMRELFDVGHVTLVGRDPDRTRALAAGLDVDVVVTLGERDEVEAAVGAADLVCCCTASREPLFDGTLVRDGATVVAVGSYTADARETDDALLRRASVVVVESRHSAAREAGDVVQALGSGALDQDRIVTLAELVTRRTPGGPATAGPRFVKTTGMPWEDLAVASAIHATVAGSRPA